ncbi:MAG: hypothetical protein HRT47_05840 [Candidatus Caenarcaniphilales bacterium]|nr:hypothetical protein [Candidatus Caenarcaniphilales bacterium]
MLSKPSFVKTKRRYVENKKILNSRRLGFEKISKSVLLWDIPLRSHVLQKIDSRDNEIVRTEVLNFIFQQKLRKDLQLQAALDYIEKPFITRSFKKVFNNPSGLNFNRSKVLLNEARKRVEYDLDLYLSFYSRDFVKPSQQQFPDYQKFLDLKDSLIDNYGITAVNFINYHYSKYPQYHDA